MADHDARFPGKINDPATETLTAKQAGRLAAVAGVQANTIEGKTLADVRKLAIPGIDTSLFLYQRVCGRVVKTDAGGVDQPVPFATVNVYDTDIGLLGWSPPFPFYTWFQRLYVRRELLRTVTTDECGRFCVNIPRWEIDFYLRWRLQRQCYISWLQWPNIKDVLQDGNVIPKPGPGPGPDPGPIHLDDHFMIHASRVLNPALVDKIREIGPSRIGDSVAKVDDVLAQRAFPANAPPPLTPTAKAQLQSKDIQRFAGRLAIRPELLANVASAKFYGPFIRCRTVIVPEWTAVLDIPDVTFEVLQDVNGDGTQEVIYSEGLFDVRWDATEIGPVTLHASSIAITNPFCGNTGVTGDGTVGILLAGNYPLKQATQASTFQDAQGFSILCNRPDSDGIPSTPNRFTPANAPFTGSFYLMGNAETAGATHYRISHSVDGGPSTYLNQGFGPLLRMVSGTLQQLVVSPVNGQWYPIVPRADGWTPTGILAPFGASDDAMHSFRLELGQASGANITPVGGGPTQPVNVHVDSTAPGASATLEWRQPDVTAAWTTLTLGNCPVAARTTTQRTQFRFTVTLSANHLRDYSIFANGCGPNASPVLITDGRDGLPTQSPNANAHWHTSASDNSATVVLHYELAAGAPAGCYQFGVVVNSRAFDPRTVVALSSGETPETFWQLAEQAPIYINPSWSVAVQ